MHAATIGAGPRVVMAHGFTQNGRCWGPFAQRLAERFEVVLVDMPGHGRSGHDDADLWAAAELLGDVGGPATYLGYSMGGRVALHLALRQPELIEGLVLIGATAGIDEAADRAARLVADEALAARLEAEGLSAFLDGWLSNPLFAGLSPEAACRTERETNRVAGLAASLRHCGTGRQEPLWDRLAAITAPMLAVAGSDDSKFSALGRRLVDMCTNARSADLHIEPGTHAVHLERPGQVAEVIARSIEAWRSV